MNCHLFNNLQHKYNYTNVSSYDLRHAIDDFGKYSQARMNPDINKILNNCTLGRPAPLRMSRGSMNHEIEHWNEQMTK